MFVFIPGAGGAAWYWHRVLPLLDGPAVAVDLPSPDPEAGLSAYMDLVVEAAADAPSVVLVAQSMGAFTAVPCAERLPVKRLVLLNAMVPAPGETANDWWRNAGHDFPEDFDVDKHFFHDLSPDVVAGLMQHGGDEAEAAFSEPCPFERWPDVPTTVLAGRDDRFFPFDFQARVARERLGLDVVPVPGGHLAALSQPEAIATALVAQ
jgi:pimeloyl-ACP methyl ester carboxylesterase